MNKVNINYGNSIIESAVSLKLKRLARLASGWIEPDQNWQIREIV